MAYTLHPPAGTRITIVGGCGGIGRTLVQACLALDLRTTVLDLPASLAQWPPPEGVASGPIDVVDRASVQAAFAGVGGVDALVNLAGFTLAKMPVAETPPVDWDAVVRANLTGAFLVAAAAIPLLAANANPGALVNVASGLAARILPGYGAYSASKAGLIALTKTLALENAPRIRANAVAPGAVDTAFLDGGTGRSRTGARLDVASYANAVPLGRIAVPDDVVRPILFLCGPGAAYITGQVLWINGGGYMP